MPNPNRDLATEIASALSLTLGTNCFYGMVRPPENGIAAKAVFCISSGGPKPTSFLGQTRVRRFSSVQVRVRGEEDDFDGGELFARQVRDAVHHASIAGYIEVEAQVSEPAHLGPDRRGYPEWSIPVEMISEG
jgi:hypothetical protein